MKSSILSHSIKNKTASKRYHRKIIIRLSGKVIGIILYLKNVFDQGYNIFAFVKEMPRTVFWSGASALSAEHETTAGRPQCAQRGRGPQYAHLLQVRPCYCLQSDI